MNVIGIDVSKAKLDCAWLDENNKLKAKVFPNALTGWSSLVEWSLKHTGLSISGLHFVMEATGVYHGQLAVYLYDKGGQRVGCQSGTGQVLCPKLRDKEQERQKGLRGPGALWAE